MVYVRNWKFRLFHAALHLFQECPSEQVILRDIHRTFPAHDYFKQAGGEGQESLYRISKAYSLYDEEVSYCQGLSFLAAALLLHVSFAHLGFRKFIVGTLLFVLLFAVKPQVIISRIFLSQEQRPSIFGSGSKIRARKVIWEAENVLSLWLL